MKKAMKASLDMEKKQHDLKKTPEGFQVAPEELALTLSTFNILTDVRTLKWVNQKKKTTKYLQKKIKLYSEETKEEWGITIDYETWKVTDVEEGKLGADSGIEKGAQIIKWNDYNINSVNHKTVEADIAAGKKGKISFLPPLEGKLLDFTKYLVGVKKFMEKVPKSKNIKAKKQNSLKEVTRNDGDNEIENNVFTHQKSNPKRKLIDIDEHPNQTYYTIESILMERTVNDQNGNLLHQYLVKWVGYDKRFDSWEPVHELRGKEAEINYRVRKEEATLEKIMSVEGIYHNNGSVPVYKLEWQDTTGKRFYTLELFENNTTLTRKQWKKFDHLIQEYSGKLFGRKKWSAFAQTDPGRKFKPRFSFY